MTKPIRAVLVAGMVALAAPSVFAQAAETAPPTSVGTAVDRMMGQFYPSVKEFLLAAVDRMPEDKMAFVPSPGARTFAQTASHIAISNLASCQRANGVAIDPAALRARGEATTTKAALKALMEDSFVACDSAFADAGDDRKAQNRATTVIHSWEVYGVMTVYLRLNGIVPPSTERQNRARDTAAAKGAGGGGPQAPASAPSAGPAPNAAPVAAVPEAPKAPARNAAVTFYEVAKKRVTQMAALMPEEGYATRASEEARSFGGAVGHMIETNFGVCAGARKETSPIAGRKFEHVVTGKAELTDMLAQSFAYCDVAVASLTPSSVAGSDLIFQIAHTSEMAGLMGGYLRTRGLAIPNAEADRGK